MNSASRRNTRAFTLMELIMVIAIILILMGLLLTAIMRGQQFAKVGAAKAELSSMEMGLVWYKNDFNTYPPDSSPSTISGENLWYYLSRKIPVGEDSKGPYFTGNDKRIYSSGGPYKEFVSVLGGHFEYKLLVDSNGVPTHYVLVDPGPDKKLGGTLNSTTGFVKTGPDADDNIIITGPN